MTAKTTSRRRRTSDEARAEILDAAEAVLLGSGPAELKFQTIAARAGLSASNVHHHFGGVAEIKRALVDRMLRHLASELSGALAQSNNEGREARMETALNNIYRIISSERYAKLVAWLALSSNVDQMAVFAEPVDVIKKLVTSELEQVMPPAKADRAAQAIVFQVAVTAVGEGLIRDFLLPVLGPDTEDIDASKLLLDMVLKA
ncbi:MAG: TetR/AcrR family transcriptional regulator [Pseudomonadota bacterium]